jgi:hypothetical protein
MIVSQEGLFIRVYFFGGSSLSRSFFVAEEIALGSGNHEIVEVNFSAGNIEGSRDQADIATSK